MKNKIEITIRRYIISMLLLGLWGFYAGYKTGKQIQKIDSAAMSEEKKK